jgi:8-oxo-dGTP pyrophosphatase MutT (NUDIX family)
MDTPTPPPLALRPAATVVLLRDGTTGLEVFLLQRSAQSDFMAGAYVFPGGKLDDADMQADTLTHLDQSPSQLRAILGERDLNLHTASGLYVAALRETYEECGVLFARGGRGARALLDRNPSVPFDRFMADGSLRLQTRLLLPWSRWITPENPAVASKRFDTRFFLAALPRGQRALHDNHEATASLWLAPRAALEQYWSGQLLLAPPQIMSLAHLARHTSVHSAMLEARSRRAPRVLPEMYLVDGERHICYPGDPRHSEPVRALPGPTCAAYRNQRFEPEGGFEALFQ